MECYDKVQTVVQDAPKEQCSLEPQRTCKHVTKLVPKLEPIEECVDVPKEVCTIFLITILYIINSGVHKVENQSLEGEKASCEKVVLRAL